MFDCFNDHPYFCNLPKGYMNHSIALEIINEWIFSRSLCLFNSRPRHVWGTATAWRFKKKKGSISLHRIVHCSNCGLGQEVIWTYNHKWWNFVKQFRLHVCQMALQQLFDDFYLALRPFSSNQTFFKCGPCFLKSRERYGFVSHIDRSKDFRPTSTPLSVKIRKIIILLKMINAFSVICCLLFDSMFSWSSTLKLKAYRFSSNFDDNEDR